MFANAISLGDESALCLKAMADGLRKIFTEVKGTDDEQSYLENCINCHFI